MKLFYLESNNNGDQNLKTHKCGYVETLNFDTSGKEVLIAALRLRHPLHTSTRESVTEAYVSQKLILVLK